MRRTFTKNYDIFFISSACKNELISAPNIMFLPNPTFDNEKSTRLSNEMSYPEQEYLSGSVFFGQLNSSKEIIS